MAIISTNTFDPLQRYIGVRLQQGVPIVDADWNEFDDIHKFELRAYLRWFVGDGVPEGNDAFRLVATDTADDFTISAGVAAGPPGDNIVTGLRHVGRCIVDGRDVLIETDIAFRAQSLHASQPSAAAVAAAWGVPTVAELPAVDGTVLLYVDVWERLVTPSEDPGLVFAGLGTESCARLRREWVLRWRAATDVPQSGDPDHLQGHSYYAIARITRRAADPVVREGDCDDLRERRLLTPPATLIEDLLDTDPIRYRQGLDRPAISLRTAINALLRGELPATDEYALAPVTTARDDTSYSWFFNAIGDPVVFWHSERSGGPRQVFAATWPQDDLAAVTAAAPVQVTTGATAHRLPHAVQLPNNDYLVVYETGSTDIHYRRADQLSGLPAATEEAVQATADTDRHPFVVLAGNQVVFFWNRNGAPDEWLYRRRQYVPSWNEADGAWLDAAPTSLSGLPADNATSTVGEFHAVVDSWDAIWTAFRTSTDTIGIVRLDPATNTLENWGNLELEGSVGSTNEEPFLILDGDLGVWIVWRDQNGVHHARWDRATDTWSAPSLAPGSGPGDSSPVGLLDHENALWLVWVQDVAGHESILTMRRNPTTGIWGSARQVVTAEGSDDTPYALRGQAGTIWLFWRSNRAGSLLNHYDLYAKQFTTAI
ncbi:MAG: DUF6519 domain-containing protein [Planctomycetota bacterium]